MNYAMERILAEEDDMPELETHPLVEQCQDLGYSVRETIEVNEFLPEDAHAEHPLHELMHGLWSAGAKLAGALNGEPGDWPPPPLYAGHALVRLKKARAYIADALAGLDAAAAEKLAPSGWLADLRLHLEAIQTEIQEHIDEVRDMLSDDENDLPF